MGRNKFMIGLKDGIEQEAICTLEMLRYKGYAEVEYGAHFGKDVFPDYQERARKRIDENFTKYSGNNSYIDGYLITSFGIPLGGAALVITGLIALFT